MTCFSPRFPTCSSLYRPLHSLLNLTHTQKKVALYIFMSPLIACSHWITAAHEGARFTLFSGVIKFPWHNGTKFMSLLSKFASELVRDRLPYSFTVTTAIHLLCTQHVINKTAAPVNISETGGMLLDFDGDNKFVTGVLSEVLWRISC